MTFDCWKTSWSRWWCFWMFAERRDRRRTAFDQYPRWCLFFAILHTRRRSLYPRHTTQCWYYRQGATVQSSLRPFHPRVPICRTIAGCHEIPYWVCHAVQQQQYRTGWIVRGRVPWLYSLRSVGVVQSCNCRCISCVLGAVLWRIVCVSTGGAVFIVSSTEPISKKAIQQRGWFVYGIFKECVVLL